MFEKLNAALFVSYQWLLCNLAVPLIIRAECLSCHYKTVSTALQSSFDFGVFFLLCFSLLRLLAELSIGYFQNEVALLTADAEDLSVVSAEVLQRYKQTSCFTRNLLSALVYHKKTFCACCWRSAGSARAARWFHTHTCHLMFRHCAHVDSCQSQTCLNISHD